MSLATLHGGWSVGVISCMRAASAAPPSKIKTNSGDVGHIVALARSPMPVLAVRRRSASE